MRTSSTFLALLCLRFCVALAAAHARFMAPEAEAHAARTFSLWAQDEYKPPVTACMPDALGRINENQESGFKNLTRTQASISLFTFT